MIRFWLVDRIAEFRGGEALVRNVDGLVMMFEEDPATVLIFPP
jgi:hypothetical protein